jgi:hypothetical protein
MKARRLVLAVVAAALAAPGAFAESWRWQGKVAAGHSVEIKGVNGGIDAAPASGGEVEVVADKRGKRSDPAGVKIEVAEHAGGVTICAVYPSPDGRPNECRPGEGGRMNTRDNDVNVDFHVRVPAGVAFVGRTVNGGIEARGLEADAEAVTVNGGIKVEAGGVVRAHTVNGSLNARMGRADWTGAVELKTVNGGITLELPADASADVSASTVNGDISTDFPLTVKGRISKRSITGTIGGGGRSLELATVNGGIEIRKGS